MGGPGIMSNKTIHNIGTFIRRKSDEIDYTPSIVIIMSDGTCQRKRLDCSGDRFHELGAARPELAFNMKEFIEGLEKLGEHGLDFRAAVEQHLETEDLAPGVKEIILAALDNKA
jgi:methylmalonyl-CoA mutase N-terminal domain/subunit